MSENLPEAPAKWLCTDCQLTCSEYLSATNPFDPDDTVVGCPNCKGVETLVAACQFEGCERESSSGNPGAYGFRYFNACWRHSPTNPANKPADTGSPQERGQPDIEDLSKVMI